MKAEPGITAKAIPLNQRSALRRLELAGLIEYRNDGWHPVTPDVAKEEAALQDAKDATTMGLPVTKVTEQLLIRRQRRTNIERYGKPTAFDNETKS